MDPVEVLSINTRPKIIRMRAEAKACNYNKTPKSPEYSISSRFQHSKNVCGRETDLFPLKILQHCSRFLVEPRRGRKEKWLSKSFVFLLHKKQLEGMTPICPETWSFLLPFRTHTPCLKEVLTY